MQVRAAKVGLIEARAVEARAGEHGSAKTSPAEIGAAKVGAGEVRVPEVRAPAIDARVRSRPDGREQRGAQIRIDTGERVGGRHPTVIDRTVNPIERGEGA